MSFRFVATESLGDNVKRIVDEQIGRILREIERDPSCCDTTVHEIRKRCKRIRAVLKLARGELDCGGVFKCENQWFRDAARSFSSVRDATVVIETYDDIVQGCSCESEMGVFAPIRQGLIVQREKTISQHHDDQRLIEEFVSSMAQARERVKDWPIGDKGFAGLAEGLRKTYRGGRRAMREAYKVGSEEAFHAWRKRVKDYFYQVWTLKGIWEPVLTALQDELKKLSDYLGDDHNLTVLKEAVAGDGERLRGVCDMEKFYELVDRQRSRLRSKGWLLGQRIYADKPGVLVGRMSKYWDAWRGGESPRID
ncbi:MAG: CHAD domain-containing protein [Sedimentisphaerales bacterium]|nr:CHAD domain-containing protein [Sedimentisphaerales bacterium]